MPYLFSNISEIKTYVGGGANLSLEINSLTPALHSALHNHVMRWLGADQYADLLADISSPSEAQTALLPYVRRPLALLAMYEYSQVGGIQMSEAGIFRMEGESTKTAYKYQETAYRQWMLNNGYEAIEQMVEFLVVNSSDYPLWEADILPSTRALWINTAEQFRAAYSYQITRYVFETLRPILEDVGDNAILPLLGPDQYDELKGKILDGPMSEYEIELYRRIRRAVAAFAVEEGKQRNVVMLEGGKVVEYENTDSQAYQRQYSPTSQAMNLSLRADSKAANIHMDRVKEYLTDNIDQFPLYKAYLDELAAAAAAAEQSNSTNPWSESERVPAVVYKNDNSLTTPSANSVTGNGFVAL